MENIHGFDFFRLHFDRDGKLENAQELADLNKHAANATDAILIAHGFRNDENDASGLYTKFLTTFRAHVDGAFQPELGARRFVVGGVFWPSKSFEEGNVFGGGSAQGLDDDAAEKRALRAKLDNLKRETPEKAQEIEKAIALLDTVKNNAEAQDAFVKSVLSVLDGSELDSNEGIEKIRSTKGSDLIAKLATPIVVPTGGPRGAGEGGVATVGAIDGPNAEGGAQGLGSFVGSVFGRIGQVLNITTWYVMKNRGGVVGGNGVAAAVRELKKQSPAVRVHLVGHSLGGRLMAACAKSLARQPKVQPDSLTLLEAAFSHYGFSANNGKGKKGAFREVIAEDAIRGPLVATFSAKDTVVGTVYAVASRLADDNTEAVGDANDPFGGIGRNGAQRTDESRTEPLRRPGPNRYVFESGKVVNLDGSKGLIQNHGDVTNENVTFAFSCVVAQT